MKLPRTGARGPLLFAGFLTILFFGVGGAWSALAPLQSAAVGQGVLVVDSNRKTVSHLEGGVVGEILVREHDRVTAGQVLIRLDKTVPQASLDLYRGQLIGSEALAARLATEREWATDIAFAPDLAGSDDPRAIEAMTAERRVFRARREQLEGQTRILLQKKAQLEEEIHGIQAQITAQDRQLALINEEIAATEQLVNKGLDPKPKLLALQRQAADIAGARGANVAKVAEARQQQGEAELRAIDLKATMLSDAVTKLAEEQTKIGDLRQKIRAAEDTLARTDIKAPVSGQVQGLRVFTVGGVIAPHEAIMDIVPGDDMLVVDARVQVNDIDVVHPGLPVTLKFSSLNQRTTPTIEGQVVNVAADRTIEERTGAAYYMVRIAIGSTAALPRDIELQAGMPVEAMIRTGSRTLLEYVAKPIMDFAGRSLHES